MISYDAFMTASLLKIDMSKAGFRDILSITDASMMYNKLSGKTFCRCMKDCALIEKIASVYYTVYYAEATAMGKELMCCP
jgi:hypothetical protein